LAAEDETTASKLNTGKKLHKISEDKTLMLRFTMNCDLFTRRPQTIASRKKGWHILHVKVMCEGAITRADMMSKLDAHKTSNTANKFAKEPIPQNKTQCTKKYNNICRNSNRKKYTFTDMQNC
jgi:hypothetical protein